jgi:acyl dehydratase
MAKQTLYLEDLQVGYKFTSGTYQMDEARMKAFAAEFDPQPFHLDEAAGAQSVFKGLAASGWHTAAVSMRLLVHSDFTFAGGIIGVGGELSWPRPTRAGDILRLEGEILEVTPSRSKPGQGMAKVRLTTLNQRDEVVQIFTPSVLLLRKNQSAS